jgi:hypothetical protein
VNGPESNRVPVRVLAWGVSGDDAEAAVSRAGFGAARAGWDFTRVERVTEGSCPVDVSDPRVIAADCGAGWAYAVYPFEGAP